MTSQSSRRRIGIQAKLVATLVIIVMVPLAVSALLVQEIGQVAQNFASNESARMRPPLVRAHGAYRDLVAAKKRVYREVARRLAATPELVALAGAPEPNGAEGRRELAEILAHERGVHGIALTAADGQILVSVRAPEPVPEGDRVVDVAEPIAGADASVAVSFVASHKLVEDYAALSRVLNASRRIGAVRQSLPASYEIAFLLVVGGIVVITCAAGIVLARRLTRRIAALVDGTRAVARGDLSARVILAGGDELAELARAFNAMVEDIEGDRRQILYLQRMTAWQDVARRLAHEIKNPLTPIQLAVQQCVSAYAGDEPRYRTLLADTEEIVEEEIAGLRRLVDAFSDLGRLPRVDPRPLDLAVVVDDVLRDPAWSDAIDARAPEAPVMVSGDRLLLRRALANLVENAVHAAGDAQPAAVVTWAADVAAKSAILTVDDHGPGIAEDHRERVFEPYITTKERGTGLGLAIAKKIALEHGGMLDVSAAPTGGARFTLSIPLA